MSKITIAIPTYNRQDYLQECIQSILNQSFVDFDILIFDNCSDYDVVDFLKNFDDDRIKLVRSEKNLGNRGNFERIFNYQYSTEYLAVFHDDDTMHPDFLKYNLNVLEQDKSLVWVGSPAKFIKNNDKMNLFDDIKNVIYHTYTTVDIIRLLMKDFDLCFDSLIYRTKYLIDLKSFGDKFFKWVDRPYILELSLKGRVAIIQQSLVNYRVHLGQDSQDVTDDELTSLLKYMCNLLNYYKSLLSQPLSVQDKNLFFSFATNNILSFAKKYSQSAKTYKYILRYFIKNNFFVWRYVNIRGVYYLVKWMIKII